MVTAGQYAAVIDSLRRAERQITTAILNAQTADDQRWEAILQRLGLEVTNCREQAARECAEMRSTGRASSGGTNVDIKGRTLRPNDYFNPSPVDPDRQSYALVLTGIAEEYVVNIADYYTRQALTHLTSAIRELAG